MRVEGISGVGEYTVREETVGDGADARVRKVYLKGEKAFLVENENTLEVRTDEKLGKLLREKYESVMESWYFGRGGIEIVTAGKQLSESELEDLVRLSYDLS